MFDIGNALDLEGCYSLETQMTQVWTSDPDRENAQAYRRLHVTLGLVGVFLPLLLALGGLMADGHVQPSISDFFHTTQRDLFVGGLVAIGIFLAAHRGFHRHPGRWLSPDLIALVAGLSAIGVAFFPNESDTVTTFTQKELGLSLAPVFHYLSALLLYLMMSLTASILREQVAA